MATYQITTNALQEATLTVSVVPPPVPPDQPAPPVPSNADYLTAAVNSLLANLAVRNQQQLLALALGRFYAVPPDVQGQVLSLLNLTDFASLPQESRDRAFAGLATDAFLALDPAGRVACFEALGFSSSATSSGSSSSSSS